MNTNNETMGVVTRNSARQFGINLTNQTTHLEDRKRSRTSKPRTSLTRLWLDRHPQIHPYFDEIALHTRLHQHHTFIKQDYMHWHSEISPPMREVLVGWLISIQPKLALSPHTLYLAVFILDKYSHTKWVSRQRYQLLGVAALFVAAKYQEVRTPKLRQYADTVRGQYAPENILEMESDILTTLGFSVKVVTSVWHLQEYVNYVRFSQEKAQLCRYILDLTLVEYDFCLVRPSVVGWAVVMVVEQMRGGEGVNEGEIAEGLGLGVGELREVVGMVAGLFRNRRMNKFGDVNCKYATQLQLIIQ